MRIARFVHHRSTALLGGCAALLLFAQAIAADSGPSLPPVIAAGLDMFAKGVVKGGGPAAALEIWQKGGLLEGNRKVLTQAGFFRRVDQAVGNFKSSELVDTKKIGQNSQIIYLALNFEKAAVYARFLLYRTDQGWVVQDMDFSSRPEQVMPWLAFQGTNYTE
jgi:hypothetical protein